MVIRLLIGLLLAAAVAGPAVLVKSLTPGGAVTATLLGSIIYAAGGFRWSALLLLFFVTSSALSRLSLGATMRASGMAAKSDRRDAFQVLANGGVAALYALLALVHPSPRWLLPFAGAIAAATADTWATEIGGRSRVPPVHLLTGAEVDPGASGGVTPLGVGASCCGAVLIALAAMIVAGAGPLPFLGIALGGTMGSLMDSLLGGTIQERRWCPLCAAMTEQTIHRSCGTATFVAGGWPGMDNDAVNALATGFGSVVAVAVAVIFGNS